MMLSAPILSSPNEGVPLPAHAAAVAAAAATKRLRESLFLSI